VTGQPIRVHWRFGRQDADGLPTATQAASWLTPAEQARAQGFTIEKRRNDWLLGRLNLKSLLVDVLAGRFGERLEPRHLFVDRLPSGAPCVRLADEAPRVGVHTPGTRLPLSVSNSHSHGHALGAAVWRDEAQTADMLAIGADLEWVEERSCGFVRDFLPTAEQRYWRDGRGDERHLRANLVWSSKESVLKVLQRGLAADTYWLTCLPAREPSPGAPVALVPDDRAWHPFAIECDERLAPPEALFTGFWREIDGFVATIAVGTITPSYP
jgi:4'-phosphopantetheinyl transferase